MLVYAYILFPNPNPLLLTGTDLQICTDAAHRDAAYGLRRARLSVGRRLLEGLPIKIAYQLTIHYLFMTYS